MAIELVEHDLARARSRTSAASTPSSPRWRSTTSRTSASARCIAEVLRAAGARRAVRQPRARRLAEPAPARGVLRGDRRAARVRGPLRPAARRRDPARLAARDRLRGRRLPLEVARAGGARRASERPERGPGAAPWARRVASAAATTLPARGARVRHNRPLGRRQGDADPGADGAAPGARAVGLGHHPRSRARASRTASTTTSSAPRSSTGRVAAGDFVEHADYAGRRYGTLRSELDRRVGAGVPVVLEIEVQGARQVREAMPEAVQVFIAPPSLEALRTRLIGRGTDDSERGRAPPARRRAGARRAARVRPRRRQRPPRGRARASSSRIVARRARLSGPAGACAATHGYDLRWPRHSGATRKGRRHQ